ncbi:MAG: UTRA domain-containing protein [Euzebyaceae bacterium]|nr:UTRA domain-containing protein [Euzebyaceae bacterium]
MAIWSDLASGPPFRPLLVERLQLADAVPTAIEWAVLASDPVAVLEKDLDGVVLHATMERMGRVPARAQARVSARLADGRERSLLACKPTGALSASCERSPTSAALPWTTPRRGTPRRAAPSRPSSAARTRATSPARGGPCRDHPPPRRFTVSSSPLTGCTPVVLRDLRALEEPGIVEWTGTSRRDRGADASLGELLDRRNAAPSRRRGRTVIETPPAAPQRLTRDLIDARRGWALAGCGRALP